MMVTARTLDGLRAEYIQTLGRYLAGPSESVLTEAYSLGRRALAEGVGLVEWATIHDEALAVVEMSAAGSEALVNAGMFFRESLSPYEMTQRGYVETNTWLERLNHDLRNEIAQKERLAEQLEESNRELEAFSYSVAHDLRAPLRHIAGFSALVLKDHAAVIDGLLVLARTARGELARKPVDLSPRANAILSRLRLTEPDRDVVVEVADSIPANGDPRLLEAVLENLLGNAWKFTSKKAQAHIEVGIDKTKTPTVYFVSDDGAGFDMAWADRLFGVFQRLHTKEAFPGTGIGLATVQRIIRKHGGRIWAESQVDRGATFYFTLDHPLP
jgi:signal transduction histidine kinase